MAAVTEGFLGYKYAKRVRVEYTVEKTVTHKMYNPKMRFLPECFFDCN